MPLPPLDSLPKRKNSLPSLRPLEEDKNLSLEEGKNLSNQDNTYLEETEEDIIELTDEDFEQDLEEDNSDDDFSVVPQVEDSENEFSYDEEVNYESPEDIYVPDGYSEEDELLSISNQNEIEEPIDEEIKFTKKKLDVKFKKFTLPKINKKIAIISTAIILILILIIVSVIFLSNLFRSSNSNSFEYKLHPKSLTVKFKEDNSGTIQILGKIDKNSKKILCETLHEDFGTEEKEFELSCYNLLEDDFDLTKLQEVEVIFYKED